MRHRVVPKGPPRGRASEAGRGQHFSMRFYQSELKPHGCRTELDLGVVVDMSGVGASSRASRGRATATATSPDELNLRGPMRTAGACQADRSGACFHAHPLAVPHMACRAVREQARVQEGRRA